MEQPAQTSNPRAERTIRRWRHAFLGVYLAFTFGAILAMLFSVLAVHCGWRHVGYAAAGPRIDAEASDRRELRRCHNELERLLADLHREAFTVQGRALRFDTDPATEWQNWSTAWHGRWQALDYRCRLGELGGTGKSPEIEKMASIHKALEELQLSYGGLVSRFAGTYVDRLRRLHTELQDVRNMIDRRQPGAAEIGGATP